MHHKKDPISVAVSSSPYWCQGSIEKQKLALMEKLDLARLDRAHVYIAADPERHGPGNRSWNDSNACLGLIC